MAGAPAAQGKAEAKARRPRAVVPNVTEGPTLVRAYRVLRHRGLRVAIPAPFSIASLCMPWADRQSPSARTKVRRGTVVRLTHLRCALASPAIPVPEPPPVLVPDLVGGSMSSAVRWAETAELSWQATELPPLEPSSRVELLDNYVVRTQSPAAGSMATVRTALDLGATEKP